MMHFKVATFTDFCVAGWPLSAAISEDLEINKIINKWEFQWKSTEWFFSSTVSRSNWNLKM